MFLCEPCLTNRFKTNFLEFPKTSGRCEMCGVGGPCLDAPSRLLEPIDAPKTQMRWRVTPGPAHIRVDVFTRTLPTETWAKAGELVFATEEWDSVLTQLPGSWAVGA